MEEISIVDLHHEGIRFLENLDSSELPAELNAAIIDRTTLYTDPSTQ